MSKRLIAFLHDVCMIPIAWFGSYWLRFNLGTIPEEFLTHAHTVFPILVLVQIAFYWSFGLYRGVWRFASLPDLLRILQTVFSTCVCVILILFLSSQLYEIPRSIFPLYGILLVLSLGGSRFCYRVVKDGIKSTGKRVLIVGAGQAGEGLVRDFKRLRQKEFQSIAFVDDMQSKQGREIHGIPVLGTCKDIPEIVKRKNIELIIICIPSASSKSMRRIVKLCEKTKVSFRTMPGVHDLTRGHVRIDVLRNVSLEDLLGRDPVHLDWSEIQEEIGEKTILVSGGGGSIGSELCRQIAKKNPGHLILLEQNEFNLYSVEMNLRQSFPHLNFTGFLTDISDSVAVKKIFEQYKIDSIFHAAAYKHVPMLEDQIRVAIRNNVLGTKILADMAVAFHVKKFVLISTDKAVNPSNVMGATKRAAEILCQNYSLHSETSFITVRFGNVLGSAGSVVPLFRKQIEEGGPVTVTHPDITRFFMTIPEASQLILQASVLGGGGEIFVLDMGEPIKISYLAEQMILLAGLQKEDIEIKYTGLRPGEKLYEELFYENEALASTSHKKIMRAQFQQRDWTELNALLQNLKKACEVHDILSLEKNLASLVPEYEKEVKIKATKDKEVRSFQETTAFVNS